MEYVRSVDDAARLSDLLRSGTDGRALVLASVARTTGRAYVDELRLEHALGETVDVYVVSPEAGRALREHAPVTRHVFGGAAQAYAPVRGGRPVVSGPLRVAFGPADVDRMTSELIEDVSTLTSASTPGSATGPSPTSAASPSSGPRLRAVPGPTAGAAGASGFGDSPADDEDDDGTLG